MKGKPAGDSSSEVAIPSRDMRPDAAASVAVDADAAFEQRLTSKADSPGPGTTLVEFVFAYVLVQIRRQSLPRGWAPDAFDVDGIATEALVELRRIADRIDELWSDLLRATIRRLVAEEIELLENGVRSTPSDVTDTRDAETVLPPSLRVTSALLLEGCGHDEICELLGIAPTLLEQRIARIEQHLRHA